MTRKERAAPTIWRATGCTLTRLIATRFADRARNEAGEV